MDTSSIHEKCSVVHVIVLSVLNTLCVTVECGFIQHEGEGTVHLLFLSKGKGKVMLSTLDLKSTYEEQGYAVARQLFTPDEVALLLWSGSLS